MTPRRPPGGGPELGGEFLQNMASRVGESISFETWLSWNGKRASVVRVSLLALLSLVWVRVSLLALLSLVCSLALVPVAWYFSLVCYLA